MTPAERQNLRDALNNMNNNPNVIQGLATMSGENPPSASGYKPTDDVIFRCWSVGKTPNLVSGACY